MTKLLSTVDPCKRNAAGALTISETRQLFELECSIIRDKAFDLFYLYREWPKPNLGACKRLKYFLLNCLIYTAGPEGTIDSDPAYLQEVLKLQLDFTRFIAELLTLVTEALDTYGSAEGAKSVEDSRPLTNPEILAEMSEWGVYDTPRFQEGTKEGLYYKLHQWELCSREI